MFEGVINILEKKGIFITEDPYLLDVFQKVSYDQIYDEHVFIFSLNSMKRLCARFNLEVIDIKKLPTAGGSLRYYIARKGEYKIKNNVKNQLKRENLYKINSKKTLLKFKHNCEKSKRNLINFLNKYSKKNIIVGYGATSKSTTIFNYCNVTNKQIAYLTDTTSTKVDKYTPEPIFQLKIIIILKNNPDICILLAWNHSNEIFKKEKKIFIFKKKWMVHYPQARFIKPI